MVVLFFVKWAEKQKRVKFRLDFLIKQGKVGIWFIIYLRQNVYKSIFSLSQDNFIFGDVISMWEMSFKNGCTVYHNSNVATLDENQSLTTIFKVAGYFSAEYVRSLEEHTQKKLEIKLERSLAPFSFEFTISNDANAPVLVEVFHLNSTALDQVESIAGDHLIIFRILDSECYHSQ